ncbi:hypothetical protein [Polaromonas jejuensis]|uniref:Apea-like HEPN domain-containing protein n=1 Tax=Polaromonas jejuensis TaxID=457502 RepID=A0ABW0Q5F6_9BURK|nr:hypothetical protein [Polaromonas jejuensis]
MSTAGIPQIQYPDEHLDDLKRITPLVLESLEKGGLSTAKGTIELGKLDPDLEVAYFYFIWVSECNGVIENLNLVLSDLRYLPERAVFLGGSPWTRYELLVRTFFHEFYRLREILNAILASCVRRGYIMKDEQRLAREAFHGAIEETIELRNSVVHGSTGWSGEDHLGLNLASTAHSRGQCLVHRETGAELTIEAALRPVCDKVTAALEGEGVKVSTIMEAFVRDTVAITRKV